MIDRYTAAARADVPPFHVMDLIAAATERARTHGDVLDLVAGQPSTGAPAAVNAEAMRLLGSGDPLGYTPAIGLIELREAIAELYRSRYDLAVGADDVVVTTGSSGGFLLAFLAAFDTGARVAIARPGYPCYRNVLAALGCEVVEVDTGPATRFQPTVEQLDDVHAQRPLDGLVVASPANPTGTMLRADELAAIARWCAEHGVQLVSDEIYHGVEYGLLDGGDRARCAWETSREAVVFGSFSKYFSMTGWRLGWMLAPVHLRRAVDVLTGNFSICPPTLAQRAAIAAFTPAALAELDGHVARYAHNRTVLLDGLRRLGLDRLAPADGAFYAYADVGHLTDDSMSYARDLLARTGVALASGIDFDTRDGGRHLRFSFAGTAATITAALDRLDGALTPAR
ncbi:aminotransferase class I/II-fold pyridoxal phosphate-dependent enzyme [Aeromicrobium sp.]|uniref:aminotransferase class I/II-fold pyridoxal phosphate-dependent enzyme n=1 Tax=Aeromicrobium sp. TaxID=1871063 RepID=UPI0035191E10